MDLFRSTFAMLVMAALVLIALCRWIIFPMWDRQLVELYQQQVARDIAQCHAQGGAWADSECRGLRKRK